VGRGAGCRLMLAQWGVGRGGRRARRAHKYGLQQLPPLGRGPRRGRARRGGGPAEHRQPGVPGQQTRGRDTRGAPCHVVRARGPASGSPVGSASGAPSTRIKAQKNLVNQRCALEGQVLAGLVTRTTGASRRGGLSLAIVLQPLCAYRGLTKSSAFLRVLGAPLGFLAGEPEVGARVAALKPPVVPPVEVALIASPDGPLAPDSSRRTRLAREAAWAPSRPAPARPPARAPAARMLHPDDQQNSTPFHSSHLFENQPSPIFCALGSWAKPPPGPPAPRPPGPPAPRPPRAAQPPSPYPAPGGYDD